ncbi:MAG: LytTR family transcriptional regulator DNA-binding domain-containing protein [Bacteroidota bacterium]
MLNNEYPAPAPGVRNLFIAVFFGIFIALFLLFFEPFDIDITTGKDSVASLFFFGFITTGVLAFFTFFLPLIFPKLFADSHWKVKHQIIFCFIILFVIATFNGLYTNYINSLPFSWTNYWWIINRTFVLGGIPFSFLILIDYRRKNLANDEVAHYILDRKRKFDQSPKPTVWSISTDLKNETFSFDDRNFSYAVASGNYIDIYLANEKPLNYKTYRMTLASFEKQLDVAHLKRCHRSYLVNMKKVINVTGNAQGLKLTLADQEGEVPVSRKYIPIVKQFFSEST